MAYHTQKISPGPPAALPSVHWVSGDRRRSGQEGRRGRRRRRRCDRCEIYPDGRPVDRRVTLIEANAEHFTCFFSNEVLSGHRGMDSIKVSYDGLKGHGINVVIEYRYRDRCGRQKSEDGRWFDIRL